MNSKATAEQAFEEVAEPMLARNLRPATVAWLEAQLVDHRATTLTVSEGPLPTVDVFLRMQQVVTAVEITLADLPEAAQLWVRIRYMSNPRPTAEEAARLAGLSWRQAKRLRWAVLRSLADRLGEW